MRSLILGFVAAAFVVVLAAAPAQAGGETYPPAQGATAYGSGYGYNATPSTAYPSSPCGVPTYGTTYVTPTNDPTSPAMPTYGTTTTYGTPAYGTTYMAPTTSYGTTRYASPSYGTAYGSQQWCCQCRGGLFGRGGFLGTGLFR